MESSRGYERSHIHLCIETAFGGLTARWKYSDWGWASGHLFGSAFGYAVGTFHPFQIAIGPLAKGFQQPRNSQTLRRDMAAVKAEPGLFLKPGRQILPS